MIQTKDDLHRFLRVEDEKMNRPNMFIKWLACSDDYLPFLLLKCLRKYEYYMNKKRNVLDMIPYFWYGWNFRRLRVKTGIMLFPNTIDEGLSLVHPGFRRIGKMSHVGKNCTILPNVLFGLKKPEYYGSHEIVIGDNCYISTGATILAPVTIGNNVTIGAGAVLIHDVPDNCVVGGVPARIIKYKD